MNKINAINEKIDLMKKTEHEIYRMLFEVTIEILSAFDDLMNKLKDFDTAEIKTKRRNTWPKKANTLIIFNFISKVFYLIYYDF